MGLLSLSSSPAVWSSPSCTGEGPPPLSGHTFTKIDLLRAVVYGGRTEIVYLTAMFILNIQTWVGGRTVGDVEVYVASFVCSWSLQVSVANLYRKVCTMYYKSFPLFRAQFLHRY